MYNELFEQTKKSARFYSNANVGVGIHSMRAVCTRDIIKTQF